MDVHCILHTSKSQLNIGYYYESFILKCERLQPLTVKRGGNLNQFLRSKQKEIRQNLPTAIKNSIYSLSNVE